MSTEAIQMLYFPANFLRSITYELGYNLVSLPVCNDLKITERMSIRILYWGSLFKNFRTCHLY